MRFIKKVSLLAVVVAAAAALTVPATASAAEWTREGEPLTENATGTFQGFLKFTGPFGSIGCVATVETALEPGGTGAVEKFKVEESSCEAGGILAGCLSMFGTLNAEELPWGFNPQSSLDIGLSGIYLRSTFNKGCPMQQLIYSGNLIAFPDNSSEISSITFNEESGKLKAQLGAEVIAVSGTLTASFEPEGVYGVE